MKTLNNYLILIFTILFFSLNGQAVKKPNEGTNNIKMPAPTWRDIDLYKMATEFNLQDSFFLNSNTIKKEYTLLRYYPKEEVLKYYDQKVKTEKHKKETFKLNEDFKLFKKEIENIQSSLEYISVLNKYPNVKKSVLEANDKIPGYENVESKLKSGKVRIKRIKDTGEIVLSYFEETEKDNLLPIK